MRAALVAIGMLVATSALAQVPNNICRVEVLTSQGMLAYTCGGTLVGGSKRHVLTSAHCIPENVPIRVNCAGISVPATYMHKLSRRAEHARDAAILKLAKPVDIDPVWLSLGVAHNQALINRDQCFAFGFGTGLLAYIQIQKTSLKAIGLSSEGYENQFVVSGPDRRINLGDSGGPVLCRDAGGNFWQVAINTFTRGEVASLSMRIGQHGKWIDDVLGR